MIRELRLVLWYNIKVYTINTLSHLLLIVYKMILTLLPTKQPKLKCYRLIYNFLCLRPSITNSVIHNKPFINTEIIQLCLLILN